MLIQTDRIGLRAWLETDKPDFAAMNKNPNIMEFLGPALSREKSDAAADKQNALIESGEPAFWAIERSVDKVFMGFVGVKKINFETDFTPGYEIGWRLGEAHWGHGFATEGAKAALEYAFSNWPMDCIFSFTVPANIRSQSVMKKIGMTRIVDGDFDHPNLRADDPLRRHVLYQINRPGLG